MMKDRRNRDSNKSSGNDDVVIGKNAVLEALSAKIPAKELYIQKDGIVDEKVKAAINLAKAQDVTIKEFPRRGLDDLAGSKHHQGVLLKTKPFNYTPIDRIFKIAQKPALIIAIDGITDPQNLGAIIRSAAAFGVVAVVIPERRNASIGGSVWKSSAGAAARIPIAQVTNLVNIMNQAKENDYFVIGLDGDGEANFENFKLYDQSLFLIVGSEGKGISRLVREKCDQILSIQITNKVESLNASVATAIALHQISSKR